MNSNTTSSLNVSLRLLIYRLPNKPSLASLTTPPSSPASSLVFLRLSRNALTTLSWLGPSARGGKGGLSHLRVLDAARNNLADLPSAAPHLPAIEVLDLHGNRL